MRTCFLHIGSHKTGTTTVQTLLGTHYEDLLQRGYLYPRSGRMQAPPGHAALAHETCDFPGSGTSGELIENLIDEIRKSDHNVILSSEVFHTAVLSPVRFEHFIGLLQSCGLQVVIITYLRNQLDYARSIYLELLKHGLADSFAEFLDVALKQEVVRLNPGGIFAFNHRNFLHHLDRLENVKIVVRSYDQVATESLVGDFFQVLGLNADELGIDTTLSVNVSLPLIESLALFYQNWIRRSANQTESQIIAELMKALNPSSVDLSADSQQKIIERFRPSNDFVCSKYGIPRFARMASAPRRREPGAHELIHMEALFSNELRHFVRDTSLAIEAARDDLIAERDALAHAHDTAIGERDALTHAHHGLIAEHEALARAGDALIAERDAFARARDTAIGERDALLASHSWRLTAPLRALRRLLP